MSESRDRTHRLAALDHAHVWHPFTPMRQWREREPVIIERGDGEYLIDTRGNRYIDGVSSLWCNVHGHRVPAIDQAIREQLDRIAHSTLLGLASTPSIELAARLCAIAPRGLNKVFFTDAGATALEVAFKMAVGYWFHNGRAQKHKFIGFSGAYHGDTTGSMSVGYSEVFHRPYAPLVFPTFFAPAPHLDAIPKPVDLLITQQWMDARGKNCDRCLDFDECRWEKWPSECPILSGLLCRHSLGELERLLAQHHDEIAAVVIEPIMQGAAGMICQPPGFLRGVADLAKKYNTLLIADEVATGFGRTGKMFACEHENVAPDIMCVGKGLTGGYLPLAATLCTDAIEQAFTGDLEERKTLYHGHTFCGNPLACAAALASLELFDSSHLLERIERSAALVNERLEDLRPAHMGDSLHVVDIRQRGLMIGIEVVVAHPHATPGAAHPPPAPPPAHPSDDYGSPLGAALCDAMRRQGLIIRPLGNTLVLMPIPAMSEASLNRMLDIVIDSVREIGVA